VFAQKKKCSLLRWKKNDKGDPIARYMGEGGEKEEKGKGLRVTYPKKDDYPIIYSRA